jgi:hypothetical protein
MHQCRPIAWTIILLMVMIIPSARIIDILSLTWGLRSTPVPPQQIPSHPKHTLLSPPSNVRYLMSLNAIICKKATA